MLLVNLDPSRPFTVQRGDRIAQLVIQRVEQVEWQEVETARRHRAWPRRFRLDGACDARGHEHTSFRFGVRVQRADATEFTELARQIEDLGFSTLFVPDHFVDTDLAPMVALTHAAAVTDTLRIGPLVLGNDYKHPAVLAKEAATLDLLSDGRLEFGIGAGWMTADYDSVGMPLDSPGGAHRAARRGDHDDEGPVRRRPVHFDGEHYRVTELDGLPKPVQQPRPPFLVGGGGRRS